MGFKTILSSILSGFSFIYTYGDSTRVMYQNLYYQPIYQAAFSPDDRQLLTSGYGSVKLWDIASGKLLHSINLSFKEEATILFSPNGKKYIVCPEQSPAFVVETNTGKRLFDLEDRRKGEWQISSFVWSPDGSKILGKKSANEYREMALAEIYDAVSGQKLFTFFDSLNCGSKKKSYMSCYLNSVDFSPDGKFIMLLYGSENWRRENHFIMLSSIDYHEVYRRDGEFFENFSNSGLQFITTSGNIYETNTGKLISKVGSCNSIGFLPGDSIIIQYCSHEIQCINIRTNEIISAFDGFWIDGDCHGGRSPSFPVNFYAIDGDKLFITRSEYIISEWNWKTGKLVNVFKDTSWCLDFQLSHNKKLLLSFTEYNIKIWSTETAHLLYNYPQWSQRKSYKPTRRNLFHKKYRYYERSGKIYFDEENKCAYIHNDDGRYTKIDYKNGKIKRNKRYRLVKFPEYGWYDYHVPYSINDSVWIEFTRNIPLMITCDTHSYILNIWFEGKKDWLISDSKGNYNGSRAMRKKIYFVRNNTIIYSRKLKRQCRNKSFWKWDSLITQYK